MRPAVAQVAAKAAPQAHGVLRAINLPAVDRRELYSIEGAVEAIKPGVFDQYTEGEKDNGYDVLVMRGLTILMVV